MCFRNWNGSFSAMEIEIILEGFLKCKTHCTALENLESLLQGKEKTDSVHMYTTCKSCQKCHNYSQQGEQPSRGHQKIVKVSDKWPITLFWIS